MVSPAIIDVLVAEPYRLVREGLRLLLEYEGNIRVTGTTARGEETVTAARLVHPHVVVMDMELRGLDALRATRLIYGGGLGDVCVVLLSASRDEDQLVGALHAGAHGVLPLDSDPAELRRAVRLVAHGGAVLAPGPAATRWLASNVIEPQRSAAEASAPLLESLTQREREVLALVGVGLSNTDIATRLAVTPATVKAHIGNASAKLHARDRAQLVMVAYETGLVHPLGTPAVDPAPSLSAPAVAPASGE
jgi:DNA-binding NarL/FixJ family response regulator